MVVAFPCKIGAPVTGITLSTRVGRLSETHSDTGFPLTQFLRWEGRRGNGKVAKSAEKYCLTQVSRQAQVEAAVSSCSAVGNLFVGKVSCGTTMNQTKRLDMFKSCSRYAGLIGPCFSLSPTASLRVVGRECHTPLLVRKSVGKPFVQGWTHTHTHWKSESIQVRSMPGSKYASVSMQASVSMENMEN